MDLNTLGIKDVSRFPQKEGGGICCKITAEGRVIAEAFEEGTSGYMCFDWQTLLCTQEEIEAFLGSPLKDWIKKAAQTAMPLNPANYVKDKDLMTACKRGYLCWVTPDRAPGDYYHMPVKDTPENRAKVMRKFPEARFLNDLFPAEGN